MGSVPKYIPLIILRKLQSCIPDPKCLPPVRAGIVGSARDWQWSSHQARIGIVKERIHNETLLPLPEAWTEYVDAPLTDVEIEKVRTSVNRQSPFGSDEWQQQTIARLGLESTVRRRGRPWDNMVK